MKFGWINAFGAGIVVLMLIPNILYAVRNQNEKNLCQSKWLNVLEQIGRYACIVLMWCPVLVWKFGFPGVGSMLLYMAGNGLLLCAYWLIFARYWKEKTATRARVLALLPACIFLLSGCLLRHWLLVGFAVLFAITHLGVTEKNLKAV